MQAETPFDTHRKKDIQLIIMPLQHNNKFLIVLLGPTGVGKTGVSLQIAQKFNAPILSSDSRQFFRELVIGTAAPTPEQLKQAPHYFVGHKTITERYSCGMFEVDALNLLQKLFTNHDTVLMVGGSMLYIDAVCEGIDNFPTPNPEIRARLANQLECDGLESLKDQLKQLDPEHYRRVDLNNPQRVLKAVEVCLQTGRTYSSFLTSNKPPRPFGIVKIGLNRPRSELYELINQRVDGMMCDGLLDEARLLHPLKHLNSLKTVGYRELFAYLEGKLTLSEAVDLIKRNSRRYAKRQLTWWGPDGSITWFHPSNTDAIEKHIANCITP